MCGDCAGDLGAYPRRGRCNPCYARWLRTSPNRPIRRRGDPSDRFWAKVEKTEACWLWIAHVRRDGYGKFSIDGAAVPAHRFSWELANGPIPVGMVIDHLCRVHNCVNPAHLEPVTDQINIRRGECAHLTPSAVHDIRSGVRPLVDVAAEFGVTPAHAQRVRTGYGWEGVA